MSKPMPQWGVLILAALVLAGCASPGGQRRPVMGYGGADTKPAAAAPQPVAKKPVMDSETDSATRIYVVQKGDTLYSIAFLNGVDYRDVAEWNNLENPAAIQIGQQLQLRIPANVPAAQTAPRPLMDSQVAERQSGAKNYPRVGKLAYTAQALAQAEQMQNEPAAAAKSVKLLPVVAAPLPVKPVTAARVPDDEEPLDWGVPTSGKVIAGYSETDNRKGVDIAGQRGQAVLASASGKVVYSGSGLRGYGKLVIIKHNKTFLSAYAHNEQILVKEGDTVSKGQKIAEMGNSDADQVKLHFEIRKLGKPVDPAKYLPLAKS